MNNKKHNRAKMRLTRELLGLTMEDVANEMQTTKQTISNMETSKTSNTMALEFYTRVLEDKLICGDQSMRGKIEQILDIMFKGEA